MIVLLMFFLTWMETVGGHQGCTPYPGDPERCFLMVESRGTWDEARDQCFLLGGDLATVETMDLLDFIKTLVIRWPFWIGLRRAANYDTNTWMTRVPFDFSAYDPAVLSFGRPIDVGEFCIRVWRVAMDDFFCNSAHYFACEFRTVKNNGTYGRVKPGDTLNNVQEYGTTSQVRSKYHCAAYCNKQYWCYAFRLDATTCQLYRVEVGQFENAPVSGRLYFKTR